jgi:hypothetical protein
MITLELRYIMQDFFVDLATKGHIWTTRYIGLIFATVIHGPSYMSRIFLEIQKCRNAAFARVYWCEPEKTMADRLRTLRCDADIIAMINESATCKNILMYVDHSNFLETQKKFLERKNRMLHRLLM